VSGLCGWVGTADPSVLDGMLAAIDYRGDRCETALLDGAALGYRWWGGRPGKSPGIFREGCHAVACAGTLAPSVPSPAAALMGMVQSGLETLDGAFAGAWWDADRHTLTLIRDPFGVRSLYYVEHGGILYFASELKQLLTIPTLPIDVDPVALHKYLTFSFVPGEDVPVRGVKRLLPGTVATWRAGQMTLVRYVTLREDIDPALEDPKAAHRAIRPICQAAVTRRLVGETEVGLYLSGGLDSSAVALWLKDAGVKVRAFSLDFGERSVEREQAEIVARTGPSSTPGP
jgi:asparagine synthase (glutamine-hydrolysing)